MADPATDLRSLGRDPVFDLSRVRPVTSGLAAARPAVAAIVANSFYFETDTGLLYFTNGTTWTQVGALTTGSVTSAHILNGTIVNEDVSASAAIAWSKISPPTFGTSLPGSPANGDYYTLTDSTTSPTYVWHLRYFSTAAKWYPMPGSWGMGTALPTVPSAVDRVRFTLVDSTSSPTYRWEFMYNAAEATYKWEFVGGNPALVQVATAETTSSTSYAALTTAGPSFTLPKAGDYDVAIGCAVHANSGAASFASMSYDIGATGAVDGDRVVATTNGSSSSAADNIARVMRKTGLTAVALTAKYKVSGNSAGFADRWMQVCPVRVG